MGDIAAVFGGHDFDCNEVQPQTEYTPLPAGWYDAMVEEAEVKTTKAGTGKYLKLKFLVSNGKYEGRAVFANLTLSNPNQTAEKIGLSQLSALGRSAGVMNLGDSKLLLQKFVSIKVAVKNDPQYGPGNEVKSFDKPGKGGASAPEPQGESKGSSAASVPPWKR